MTDASPRPARTPRQRAGAPPAPTPTGQPRLLTGGNPQIPKGDGAAPVLAYIAAMPGWKRDIGARIDALVAEVAPEATRAVRWNVPFWGMAGRGWMLSLSCTTRYVKLAFLTGADLSPPPPVASRVPRVRYLHILQDEPIDLAQLADWSAQAFAQPGDPLF
jgi:hypothetical protein